MSAPASDPALRKLRDVRNLEDLTAYLRDELEWPIADFDIEELTFEYTPEEAGLDPESATKVASIRRLRPLSNDAPWGIFFLDFRPGDLPITVLRRILRAVVIKKREAGRPDRPAWQMHDLLFISALGEDSSRDINLAHFSEDPSTSRATLRVVEWDAADTHLHMLRVSGELKRLAWREPGESIDAWRERWASAFELKPGESAKTAKMLAHQMAVLAKFIRQRVNDAIAVESEGGPLRKLYAAFREVLLHDLTTDGFADMYAQTITYGLFAARRSRPMGITIDNAKDMIPSTNPFLRDLLAQFTDASGLTKSLDFDELGVDALIQTLNAANIEAVVSDFGTAKPGEDPVIHFYEDFLREYNKAQKIQRGVFYTPKPVVSFIVRSLHELLQTEFPLPDGLASTETWGHMVAKFPELKIPDGATKDTPFVQVLDPAVGTGTFLVEVIDVIHRTLSEKWKKQGYNPMFDFERLWNEYVPAHLLPRLYGFELMMASYTICHMKVGLKLADYGYKFGAAERLRIYLTNTLEPAHDFSGQFDIMAPALAHEARAVNEVKLQTRFTVVVGNPPYSGASSNMNAWIDGLLRGKLPSGQATSSYYEVDGRPLGERKLWLQDDYVKFLRDAQWRIDTTGTGMVGLITNHSYLDGPTYRGMRFQLMEGFSRLRFVDLHGSLKRSAERRAREADENVFDIQQGVAICLLVRNGGSNSGSPAVETAELWGVRDQKYHRLLANGDIAFSSISPVPPFYLFVPHDPSADGDYEHYLSIKDLFVESSSGIQTSRDAFVVGYTRNELAERISTLADPDLDDDLLRLRFSLQDGRNWTLARARRDIRNTVWADSIQEFTYRVFDDRFVCNRDSLVNWPRRDLMDRIGDGNLVLLVPRQLAGEDFRHVWCTRKPSDMCVVSSASREAVQAHPLYLEPRRPDRRAVSRLEPGSSDHSQPNLVGSAIRAFESALGLLYVKEGVGDLVRTFGPDALFQFVYGILNSPGYRARYAEQLRLDFARVPIVADASLFRRLRELGSQLVAAHLLEPPLNSVPSWLELGGVSGRNGGAERFPTWKNGRVYINEQRWIESVPSHVWEFRIGAYQVCEKWLKDRRGRTLTPEDIEHYKRIIGAITETIRIQKEIDEVIEAHGGWPLPGSVPMEAAE